jgi:hypothetical protein
MKKRQLITTTLVMISVLAIGLCTGYAIPRDVKVQVIEASGIYVSYYDNMIKYVHPYNNTDNVTMLFHGNTLKIDHTYPDPYGMRYFTIGFDNNGFIKYILQLREK